MRKLNICGEEWLRFVVLFSLCTLHFALILFAFSYECDEYNQCYKVYSMMMLELEGREKIATNAAVAQERNQWNLGKNKTEIFPFFLLFLLFLMFPLPSPFSTCISPSPTHFHFTLLLLYRVVLARYIISSSCCRERERDKQNSEKNENEKFSHFHKRNLW